MQVIRKEPKNLRSEDTWLFKHELKREFVVASIVEKNNIFIKSNIEFSERLRADTLVSKQANFFKFSFLSLLKKVIKFKFSLIVQKHAIITDGWSFGYFHWLMDCLPRLMLLRSSGFNLPLILPQGLESHIYVKESLLLLGENNYRFLKKDKWYFLKTLVFPSHLASTGNYNDRMMQKLRQSFAQGIKERPFLKAYISRSKSSRRKIANEEDILPVLQKAGFEEIFCEDLPFAEQVKFFSKVKFLVTNHGAGLSNLLFMPSGTRVLELRRENDGHNNCYFSLASALDITYYYQNCLKSKFSEDLHNADIVVNAELLSNNLKLMTSDV